MGLSTITHNSISNVTYGLSGFTDTVSDSSGNPKTFAAGTSTGQCDLIYRKKGLTVTSGAPVTIDLTGGGLLQPDGSAFNAVKVTSVRIIKTSTPAGSITVNNVSNELAGVRGFCDPIFHVVSDTGITVTAGTGDLITLAASAGTITYDIEITARSV